MNKHLSELYSNIGYEFKNLRLIETALTHSSNLNDKQNNDILEFLGDRVLGLVIASKLYNEFPQSKTGDLAQRFNQLVRAETLVEVAEKISLGKFIYVSSSEEKTGGRSK